MFGSTAGQLTKPLTEAQQLCIQNLAKTGNVQPCTLAICPDKRHKYAGANEALLNVQVTTEQLSRKDRKFCSGRGCLIWVPEVLVDCAYISRVQRLHCSAHQNSGVLGCLLLFGLAAPTWHHKSGIW